MRFFPVACLVCCAVASVWTVSKAAHWIDRDVMNTATLEAFVLSRSLVNMEMECVNMTCGRMEFSLSGFFPESVKDLASALLDSEEETENKNVIFDSRFQFSVRRYKVAFEPVHFDDMYSIDKRGNTLHFVDDATSIAKLPYPFLPSLRRLFRPLFRFIKVALPVGINIAHSS